MTETIQPAKTSAWLDERIASLNPPAEPILTDPNDAKRVIMNNDFAGSRFTHPDGDVVMAVYILGSEPGSRVGVGAAVIFMSDDTRMYKVADSIQGVHFEKAQEELLADYMEAFGGDHKPKAKGMAM